METKVNNYIVIDSEIYRGVPVFKGTRIMIWQGLELLGAGVSIDEILKDYFPQLTKQAILSVLMDASKVIGEEGYVFFRE